ncbi:Fe-S cluster assembly ATPase SufC [Chitinophaga sp. S165]|uniref:Fe-S cluster assembly ATPase SufC n=1 Tax=Chitinophaga sp. S165 TaxID=2135462 RepID=UPI000D715C1C|nr:Fe-S cluster assembly ATPase SufC [Chitinophaga sp. S165]PWV55873.1 Fe-S cluster assembly ATP-binding protein [Chitinophaga sp. S165]
MLQIRELHATVNDKEILKGLNLTVKPGEVHAIMGPNGSGKSTTASVLSGNPGYTVTKGSIRFYDQNIITLKPEERAGEGIFMAFQYPVEIPGVSNINFLRTAIGEIRAYKGLPPMETRDFVKMFREKQHLLQFSNELAGRSLNEGFSGGEKKRNEILQLAMLEPRLAILDETDSGLDIDALRIVSNGVNKLRSSANAFVLITHYQRLLEHIEPDFVHVLYKGRIVRSGTKELAGELEAKGYDWLKDLPDALTDQN